MQGSCQATPGLYWHGVCILSQNNTDKKLLVDCQIAVVAVECKKIDPPGVCGKRVSVARKKGKGSKKFSGPHKPSSRQRKPAPRSHPPAATKQDPVKRSKRAPTKRELRAASLPPPAPCRPGSAEFKQLEAKWYAKIEAAGFDDLERTVRPDGSKGTNADYLKGSAARGRTWSPERAQFYRLLQNYITHHQFASMQDRWVMHRMNDGGTYREILAECKRKYRLKRSLYWFYYYVQDLVKAMVEWNISHAEGMLNPAAQDAWATDALLSDLHGTAGVIEAPNGLKLDQGWWLENAADWWRNNGGH